MSAFFESWKWLNAAVDKLISSYQHSHGYCQPASDTRRYTQSFSTTHTVLATFSIRLLLYFPQSSTEFWWKQSRWFSHGFLTHLHIQSTASVNPVPSRAEHACICQSRSFNFGNPINSATSLDFIALGRSCLFAITRIGTFFNFSSFSSSLNSVVLSPTLDLSLLST